MARSFRRTLLVGAAFGAAGLATNPQAVGLTAVSPMQAAGARLAALNELNEELSAAERDDEADEVVGEMVRTASTISDGTPQTVADAVVLLMAAVAEINADDFYNDGTEGHEHGEVMVLRAIHFLAQTAGIDPVDYGARWYLPGDYRDALTGPVAEATRQLSHVDDAEADRRRSDYAAAWERHAIRAAHGLDHAGWASAVAPMPIERFGKVRA